MVVKKKKLETYGLDLQIADWQLIMTEPNQVAIHNKSRHYFFPNIKMATQYIKQDIALRSGCITTIEQLETAFDHADTLVMDVLGKLPF